MGGHGHAWGILVNKKRATQMPAWKAATDNDGGDGEDSLFVTVCFWLFNTLKWAAVDPSLHVAHRFF
jgi:hypothetical protein